MAHDDSFQLRKTVTSLLDAGVIASPIKTKLLWKFIKSIHGISKSQS